MTPKTVVCPLMAPGAVDALTRTATLCDSIGAHLTVPLVEAEPAMPIAVEGPVSDIWVNELNELRTRIGVHAQSLEDTLHSKGLSSDVQVVVPPLYEISHVAGRYARLADLAVASNQMRQDADMRNRTVFGLLFESGRPVLIEPENEATKLTLEPRTALVAWDGGLPASRAILLALDSLCSAQSVHVVCVDPKGGDTDAGQAPGWDLATYLSRHQIEVTVSEVPSAGRSIDEVLRRHAMEIGAELLVMGAYGRSRLRERLLGGTTRALLDHCEIPVLMAH